MLDPASTIPSPVQRSVLLVIPEPVIRDLVAANLRQAGYYTFATGTPGEGRSLVAQVVPDAIVVDLDFEREAVVELTTGIRQQTRDRRVPVLALTGNAGNVCGSLGSGCQADECVIKPFYPNELVQRLARLFAKAKRASSNGVLRVGLLELDPHRHVATAMTPGGEQELQLRSSEFKLLHHLMAHNDRVLRRDQLTTAVWGENARIDVRTVDQTVKRLRQGLGTVALEDMVQTVRGVGYRLVPLR